MFGFELMSEKVVRLVSYAVLLTLAFFAVKFFKVWYIAVLEVVYTPGGEGILSLSFLCCVVLIFLAVRSVKKHRSLH